MPFHLLLHSSALFRTANGLSVVHLPFHCTSSLLIPREMIPLMNAINGIMLDHTAMLVRLQWQVPFRLFDEKVEGGRLRNSAEGNSRSQSATARTKVRLSRLLTWRAAGSPNRSARFCRSHTIERSFSIERLHAPPSPTTFEPHNHTTCGPEIESSSSPLGRFRLASNWSVLIDVRTGFVRLLSHSLVLVLLFSFGCSRRLAYLSLLIAFSL